MDAELKEAIDVIRDLRAMLQLAYHDRDEIDVNEVDASLNAAGEFMRKHGETDDMLGMKYPED